METIIEVVQQFLEEDGWPVEETEDESIVSMQYEGENGEWTCYAQAVEEDSQFIFYSVNPLKVPDGREAEMAEFLTRVNYGLRMGNFEMDYEDGTIRYKTCIDVDGDRLTPALVKNVVYANVQLMDHYTPGMIRLIFGGLTPAEAVAEIEDVDAAEEADEESEN